MPRCLRSIPTSRFSCLRRWPNTCEELRQPDTALSDRRARRFYGFANAGTVTEMAHRDIRIIGTFSLGPDFTTDGTLIMSDRSFLKFFAAHVLAEGELADVEFGVVKVQPGHSIEESSAI